MKNERALNMASRSFAVIGFLASALVVSFAQGAPAPPRAPAPAPRPVLAKVAVISFQLAVFQTADFRNRFDALKKKYTPRTDEIKSLNDEISNLDKQLQADSDKLTEKERESRAATIDRKKSQAQRITKDAQNDFQGDVQQIYSDVATKLNGVVTDYAKKHGYTMVIGVVHNAQKPSPVLWSNPSADITQAVVDEFNTRSGAPAPAAHPAAKPARPVATPGKTH